MLEVWGVPIIADVEDIVRTLQSELMMAHSELLKDVKPTFNNVMVTCINPNHKGGLESKPSCGISTCTVKENNKIIPAGTAHCFTCGYVADLATFVSNCFGYEDNGMYGYKWIVKRFVSIEVSDRKPLELFPETTETKLEYITEEELKKYRYTHPYMYKRGMTDKIIEYFDIGYDKESKSLTFPICDKDGNVVFIQRRSVKGKYFSFPADSVRSNLIFGLDKVVKNLNSIKEITITESITDCLSNWVNGRPAVSTLSCRPTSSQIRLLNELPIRKMISGYDNDKWGELGTDQLSKYLKNKILYRIQFPEGRHDMNEFTAQEFEELTEYIY